MEICEWNPKTHHPAMIQYSARLPKEGQRIGCTNEAVLSVGTGQFNFHLCESCAALPEFKRKRKRVPLKMTRAK